MVGEGEAVEEDVDDAWAWVIDAATMGKLSKERGATSAATKQCSAKKKSRGLDEIDSLFAEKKESAKEMKQQVHEAKEQARQERKRRKRARLEEEEEELVLRGSASAGAATGSGGGSSRKPDAVAPSALHERAKKLSSLKYTRADLDALNGSSKESKNKWASDGLGGVFNGEGFTGRRDDGGHRVFKSTLMNREGAGSTPQCPFDCDCCFI